MTNLKRFFLFLFISTFTFSVYSSNSKPLVNGSSMLTAAETMTLTITVNSISEVKMQNVPLKGYLEVYSILGKREKRIKLDGCEGEISIELPKGLYILKAEKVTQKIRIQ